MAINGNPINNLANREATLSIALEELRVAEDQMQGYLLADEQDQVQISELRTRTNALKGLIGTLRGSISYHKEDLNQEKSARTKLGEISKG